MAKLRDVDRFCNIPNYVLASEAVRTLQPSHFMVLVYVAMRCYGAKRNGHIVFANRSGCLRLDNSHPQRKYWRWVETPIGPGPTGMGKSTIGEGLVELERRGLIRCTRPSTFGQKRLARTYRLTWVRTETEQATNEFLDWRPEYSKPRPTRRPDGHALGRSTGRTPASTSSIPDIQADGPAYQQPHRPPHRPRSHQVNRDVGAWDMGSAMAAIAAEVRAAAGPAPASADQTDRIAA